MNNTTIIELFSIIIALFSTIIVTAIIPFCFSRFLIKHTRLVRWSIVLCSWLFSQLLYCVLIIALISWNDNFFLIDPFNVILYFIITLVSAFYGTTSDDGKKNK